MSDFQQLAEKQPPQSLVCIDGTWHISGGAPAANYIATDAAHAVCGVGYDVATVHAITRAVDRRLNEMLSAAALSSSRELTILVDGCEEQLYVDGERWHGQPRFIVYGSDLAEAIGEVPCVIRERTAGELVFGWPERLDELDDESDGTTMTVRPPPRPRPQTVFEPRRPPNPAFVLIALVVGWLIGWLIT